MPVHPRAGNRRDDSLGDFILPYLSAPFVPEGDFQGLLDVSTFLSPRILSNLLYGHEPFDPKLHLLKLMKKHQNADRSNSSSISPGSVNRRCRSPAASDGGECIRQSTIITRRVEIERFATSLESFEAALSALRATVGNPDMAEFVGAIKRAPTFAEFEGVVRRACAKRD